MLFRCLTIRYALRRDVGGALKKDQAFDVTLTASNKGYTHSLRREDPQEERVLGFRMQFGLAPAVQ